MKKAFQLLFLFIGLFSSTYSQTTFQINNLAAFCKVWGFLKYYHPYPSRKSVDWDTVLVNNYQKVKAAQSKEEFNGILLSITQKTGELKPVKHSFHPSDSEAINADFKWMDDTTILSSQLCEYLKRVKLNHLPFKNKYVKAIPGAGNPLLKEDAFPRMQFPDQSYRFLALARYWNIIQYYFPDKYLIDTDWNISLKEAIPVFMDAKDTMEYYRAIEWVTARTDDSHANWVTPPSGWISKNKFPPLNTFYHEDTMYIIYVWNDSISGLFNIRKGDKIIAFNGASPHSLWRDLKEHHSASNESYYTYMNALSSELIRSDKDSSDLVIIRNGKEIHTRVKNYSLAQYIKIRGLFKPPLKNVKPYGSFSLRTDSSSGKKYLYVNMGMLCRKEVKPLIKELKNVEYLMLDDRNYPKDFRAWTRLANNLIKGRKYFAKYTTPDYKYPGYFVYHPNCRIIGLFRKTIGRKRNNYFNGKTIILVNHGTQSQAEYEAMTLQLIPNSILIGTQTAGADGNVSTIIFPGNYSVWATCLGWYYSDGRQTQRIGIVPDIKVDYTLQSMLHHTDPIIQRALEFIRTGK